MATQNQLELAEEKLDEARQKVSTAESRWEARLKELEQRCRAAEEKTKRERQGGKERVAELLQQVKYVLSDGPCRIMLRIALLQITGEASRRSEQAKGSTGRLGCKGTAIEVL